MTLIAASILDADYARLQEEVTRVDAAGVDAFTLDIMDGHFAPRITFGDHIAAKIREWTRLPIEVHLMVNEPERWARRFCDAGADLIIFHIEAACSPLEVVKGVRAEGRSVGIALLSETPVEAIPDPLLVEIDLVNLLAVPVGFGGNFAASDTLLRVKELRRRADALGTDLAIEVDGGVKPGNASEFVRAGVDMLTVGTGIYHAPDVDTAVHALRSEAAAGNVDEAKHRLELFLSRPSRKPVDDESRRRRQDQVRESLDIPTTNWDPMKTPII
jgi:ribulose-phosphate 3-epimerase